MFLLLEHHLLLVQDASVEVLHFGLETVDAVIVFVVLEHVLDGRFVETVQDLPGDFSVGVGFFLETTHHVLESVLE